METAAFIDELHEACAASIKSYTESFPDGPPITANAYDLEGGAEASTADVQDVFEELVRFYDDLFDVDSTPYRAEWRSHIVYDCRRRDRLAHLTTNLPWSLGLVFIGARYAASTGHIGVSTGRLSPVTAYSFLASELCHAYQHRFESPTWSHQNTQEGFEAASAVRALQYLSNDLEDETVARRASREEAKFLLRGVLAHGVRSGGIEPRTLRDLGVPDAEVTELLAHPVRRIFTGVRPRYQWSEVAYASEYDLVSSLLLVSERLGVEDTFATAFDGEHPWTSLMAELLSEPSPWLWRQLYT